jgi:hypothetical protein
VPLNKHQPRPACFSRPLIMRLFHQNSLQAGCDTSLFSFSLLYLWFFLTFSHAQHPRSLALFKANFECVNSFFDQCSSCQNYARSLLLDSSFDNPCTCGYASYQTAAYISRCVSQVGLDIDSDSAISSAIAVYSAYCAFADHPAIITHFSPGVVTIANSPSDSSIDLSAVPEGRLYDALTQPTAGPSPPEFCPQIWAISEQQFPTITATQSKIKASQKLSIRKMIQWSLFAQLSLICLALLFAVQRCRPKTISTCVPALRVIISMWTNLVDAILWHFGSNPLGDDGQHMDCVRISCHSCPSHTHLRSESMPIPTVHEARSRNTVRC